MHNLEYCPCGWCQGQRTILEPAKNGEGYIPTQCPACVGTGFTIKEIA